VRVAELWRFPVKSLQGERLEVGELGAQGLAGDRRYAIFDVETGFGLTARRVPAMLFASAVLGDDGDVRITLPDGSVAADDEALSAWLGRAVQLRSCDEVVRPRYENPEDTETEAEASWQPFEGSDGAFHDAPTANVTLLSTASMRGHATRRFRANIVLDGDGEDGLVGTSIRIGGGAVEVTQPIPRCVMVTRPQPGGIELDRDVLRWIHRERDGLLAVGGVVTRSGPVRVGDEVAPDR
jgi:uncharacterized protein